ncbi:MAG TPA: ComEC/Rec2 family competence protein [Desulfatiglandales bacterium]|nr:ComEC/Rec2 family competence protein [Desulfatiglandales bacterium]
MFSRPLVPALCITIIGILIGHNILTNVNLPVFLFPLIILLCLGIIFIIPFKFSIVWLMAIFMLIGINTQISRPTLSELPQIILKNERVIIEGTVYRPPKIQFNTASCPIHAEKIFFTKKDRRVKINLLLKIYGYRGDLKVGERIRFPAKLKEFENFNNPGNFDYRFYMKSRGLSLVAIVTDGRYVVPMGEGNLGFAGSILEKARGPLRQFFHERLSKTTSPIYTALILGERQGLTSKLREPFDRSGVSHIMAVSGLHLGLVAWLFFISIRWLLSLSYRVTLVTDIRKLAAIITTVPVIAYALLTGLQISTQRAMVMVLIFLWSFIIGREKDVWSSLSLAALIILTLNGDALFTISFQLSFGAVAGILWLAPLIFSRIAKFKKGKEFFNKGQILHSILTYTLGLIAVTTAATIMTIPLIAHHFHRFSIVALPANLTVVPIIGLWVIPLGLLSSITLLLSSTLAGFLLSLGEFGLNLAISLVQFWSDIPWSSIWVIRPSWLEIVLLYGVFFLSLNFTLSRLYRIFLLLFLIVFFIDIGWWVYKTRCNSNLRVTILDAGNGDVSLIQFPGKEKMLITNNAFGQNGFNLGRIIVAPYLWHEKIQRIDHLFLSSPQVHQTENLQFMIKNFHPKGVFFSLSTERVIKEVKIKTGNAQEIMLDYQGWSLHFYERQVQIENKNKEVRKQWPKFFIITKETKKQHSSFPTLNIRQTGALTITIDPEGNLKMKSFLNKNLNVNDIITIHKY